MDKISERIFEALLVEFLLGFIGYLVGDKFTQLVLLGLGTLIAATIVFVPKITSNHQKSTSQEKPSNLPPRVPYTESDSVSTKYQNIALWFQWVLTGGVGGVVIATMSTLLAMPTSGLVLDRNVVLAWLLGGSAVGLLQWLILRKQFQKASQWIIATIVGWGLGSMVFIFINHYYFQSVIQGFVIGLLQWLVLRQHFERASWWIIARIADFVILSVVIAYEFYLSNNSSYVIGSFEFGVFESLVSGVALVYLLRIPFKRVV